MMLFLKRNLSLLRFSSLSSSTSAAAAAAAAAAAHNPSPIPKSQFVTDYLIQTCGFSPKKAATASKYMKFTSPSKPDSVRHFLKHHAGFTDVNIRSVISRDIRILNSDVGKTMEPNLKALLRISSWSGSDLHQLIICSPSILMYPHAISRLKFWKNFLNGDTKKLVLAAKRNLGLFGLDVETGTIAQKMKLLNEYGFSQTDIQALIVRGCGIFCRSTASLQALLEKVKELGFPRGSPVFMHGLYSLCHIGIDALNAKMKCFERCGWSESEFLAAFQKYPAIVGLSEENVRDKMEFLVGTTGCKHSYIASRPLLLTFSLEKRMMPRLHVMNILTSHDLLGSRTSIFSLICISESKFLEKFVHLNKEKVPELHNIYTAACAGQTRL